jgi:replicative DNA helicase
MHGGGQYENRALEVAAFSRGLKQLAKELEVPVVALSQLSRASEQRGGERKPILSDLRDSGAIEQDADLVIFIHRPEYYDREDESKRGLAEIMLAKNRNGPTGDVQLKFTREYTRFDSFSGRDDPE